MHNRELLLTRRSADTEVGHATAVAGLPQVADALRSGVLDRRRAIVLADACTDLTDQQTANLLDTVLPQAGTLTATALAARVRQVAIALDPAWAERRYRQAVRQRRVVGYLDRDGTGTVPGQGLPADQAAAAITRVTDLAGQAKRAGAAATPDHLRAEIFLGLLDGRFHQHTAAQIITYLLRDYPHRDPTQPDRVGMDREPSEPTEPAEEREPAATPAGGRESARRGVHLRIGLGTLLGLDDQPGVLPGWGPITADVARAIVAGQRGSQWRYAVHDAEGRLLFDGTTGHRPQGVAGQVRPPLPPPIPRPPPDGPPF